MGGGRGCLPGRLGGIGDEDARDALDGGAAHGAGDGAAHAQDGGRAGGAHLGVPTGLEHNCKRQGAEGGEGRVLGKIKKGAGQAVVWWVLVRASLRTVHCVAHAQHAHRLACTPCTGSPSCPGCPRRQTCAPCTESPSCPRTLNCITLLPKLPPAANLRTLSCVDLPAQPFPKRETRAPCTAFPMHRTHTGSPAPAGAEPSASSCSAVRPGWSPAELAAAWSPDELAQAAVEPPAPPSSRNPACCSMRRCSDSGASRKAWATCLPVTSRNTPAIAPAMPPAMAPRGPATCRGYKAV